MKIKIILLFVLFYMLNSLQGRAETVIFGSVKSSQDFNVHIYEPVNGYFNMVFFDSTGSNSAIVNGKDSIYKELSLTSPSFVTVYFTNKKEEFITRSDILVFPGDSVHLTVNLDEEGPNSIIYGGSNSAGQQLFNEINFVPYNKFIPVFDLLDGLPGVKDSLVERAGKIASATNVRFDSLHDRGLITWEFAEYMAICFRSIIFYQVTSSLLSRTPESAHISGTERDSMILALFALQPPTDKRLRGLYMGSFYLLDYYEFLICKRLGVETTDEIKKQRTAHHINGKDYSLTPDFISFAYIENDDDRADLWAQWILFFFSYPGKYDFSMAEQYDSIFGNNKWSSLFSRQYKSSGLAAQIEYKLQSPVHYIDTADIDDLADVFRKLPQEQPVFVDLWATWCYPCIAAFGFNTRIDSFLISQNINRLYISFDNGTDYPVWEHGIQKYALGGYHILANKKLKRDIAKKIYHISGNEGMGIPRYALVYNGRIIVDDFTSPARTEAFFKQMQAAIGLLKETAD